MDKLGHHKRDLMVSDVKKACDAQQDAKEQFKSALDRFTKTLNIQGGELQEKYDVQNGEYERSGQRAQAVRDRIEADRVRSCNHTFPLPAQKLAPCGLSPPCAALIPDQTRTAARTVRGSSSKSLIERLYTGPPSQPAFRES